MATKRSYRSGRAYARTDANGREMFYGSWWANGRRMNRRLGVKRPRGSREGLTATQAEERLRELIAETEPTATRRDRLTLSEAGARYRRHLEKGGRTRAADAGIKSTARSAVSLLSQPREASPISACPQALGGGPCRKAQATSQAIVKGRSHLDNEIPREEQAGPLPP